MAEKKRKTELDIEGIVAPKVEAPPPPPTREEAPPPEVKEESDEDSSTAAQKKKLIMISVAASVLLIIVIALVVKSRMSGKKEAQKVVQEAKVETRPTPPKIPPVKIPQLYHYTLEPFILPVRDKNGERLIRLGLTLQLSNEDAIAEAKDNVTLIRKAVLFYINTRDTKELLDAKSRTQMLEDIKFNVDRSLRSGRAQAVLINEFVVY
jgi:flagellar basal body-associated protein FliL